MTKVKAKNLKVTADEFSINSSDSVYYKLNALIDRKWKSRMAMLRNHYECNQEDLVESILENIWEEVKDNILEETF